MRHPQPMEFAFFAARAGPHARPLDLKATPVEADFALGPAPAVGRFAARTPIAAAAQRGGIVFHPLGQGRDPSREAEALETGADSLPGFGDNSRRVDGRWCAIRLRGVTFLCRLDTPSLAAQGGQRRLPYFNTRRDIPWKECLMTRLMISRCWRWAPLVLQTSTLPSQTLDRASIRA